MARTPLAWYLLLPFLVAGCPSECGKGEDSAAQDTAPEDTGTPPEAPRMSVEEADVTIVTDDTGEGVGKTWGAGAVVSPGGRPGILVRSGMSMNLLGDIGSSDTVDVGDSKATFTACYGFSPLGDQDLDGHEDVALGYLIVEDESGHHDAIEVIAIYRGPFDGPYDLDDSVAIIEGSGAGFGLGLEIGEGDVNGDGIRDILASEPYRDLDDRVEGAIYVLDGPVLSSGLIADADVMIRGDSPNDYLSLGGNPYGAGDFNKDGYSDILATEHGCPNHNSDCTMIINGPVSSTEETALDVADACVVTEEGGLGTTAVGDFDGDGNPDLAIGFSISGYDVGVAMPEPNGSIRIFPGPIEGTLDALDAATVIRGATRAASGEGFGESLVAMDINGDSITDLFAGDFEHGLGGSDTVKIEYEDGETYAFLGPLVGDMTAEGAATVVLQGEDTDTSYGAAGYYLDDLGDLNSDGIHDLGISAPFLLSDEGGEGRGYVFFGDPAFPER